MKRATFTEGEPFI